MIRQYVLTTEDADRWRTVLPADVCVMGSLEHARISQKQTGYAAELFVVESAGIIVAYPFFLRPLNVLPFATDLGQACWDTFTPEYTGPIPFGPGPLQETVGPGFADLFASHCHEQRIVAEFAHLNPWNAPAELLDPACVEMNRQIVYMDLTWGEERLWTKSLTHAARGNVKQAHKAGVRVRRAESHDDVREFHRLYQLTMEWRQALDRYYFAPEYFLAFFDTMPENSFFVLAEYQGRAVAGGLFFHDGTDVYWHLSAIDREFYRVRPVNAYVWDTARWALRQDKKRMVLGGGHEPDDGVFRFKAGFSPLRAQFRIYKRVHDANLYAELTRAWSAHNGGRQPPTDFFPAYRCV